MRITTKIELEHSISYVEPSPARMFLTATFVAARCCGSILPNTGQDQNDHQRDAHDDFLHVARKTHSNLDAVADRANIVTDLGMLIT